MIVEMNKAFVVTTAARRAELVDALGKLGMVHLTPVDPDAAVPDETLTEAIASAQRAAQILAQTEPADTPTDVPVEQAAGDVIQIYRRSGELRNRLLMLHRQAQQLAVWGDVRLEQIKQLRSDGLNIQFYSAPADTVDAFTAEGVQTIAELGEKRMLVGVVTRGDAVAEIPEQATPVELPKRDRPSLIAEAKDIDAQLQADQQQLAALAHLAGDMETYHTQLRQQARIVVAKKGALIDESLFAIQGWVPAADADELSAGLAAQGIDAAVEFRGPDEEDAPPTLVRYPRWARPIKGLFDILGTFPGYREYDLSPFFMIALPLFAAMLIGDAGYGLLFVSTGLVFYRKLVKKAGKAQTHLLLVVGAATLLWGILTANYFGITPESIASAGGFERVVKGKTLADVQAMQGASGTWALIGRTMIAAAPVYRSDAEAAQRLLMQIAFIIGAIHLSLAQLRKAVAEMPDVRFIASVGWAVFLWGMFGVIWYLMFDDLKNTNWMLCGPPLAVGYLLVLLFASAHRNPLKRIALGFASSLLPVIGTFSDTMSYIRLMAVGLASYYIAAAFNGLGASLAETITWYSVLPILVVLFGHALNIGLAMIAIFAHGVRLNMLEFSNNAGVQWAGYAYSPFACNTGKES